MKKLTEEMVIIRTKISDITKIKKLNCWGTELADISLLRRMPNVEVLSLSINKINGLSDFEDCRKLQELYIRQNEIKNLNEVCYLQNLMNLKHLFLGENPCASAEGYRLAVIRALPNLQKLDGVVIEPDELADAMKNGRVLIHPDDHSNTQDYPEEYHHTSPVRELVPPDADFGHDEELLEYYDEDVKRGYNTPPTRQSPPRKVPESQRFSPEQEPSVYYEDKRNANSYDPESPKHQHYYEDNKSQGTQFRQREGSDCSTQSVYESQPRERCEKGICPLNIKPPFKRRPMLRNSNILSAVLCLVKELDYPSLEVVEMAVRCRMDELNE